MVLSYSIVQNRTEEVAACAARPAQRVRGKSLPCPIVQAIPHSPIPRSIDIRVYLVIYFTKQKVEETVSLQGFRSLVCGLKDEYGIYQERTG